ncbi:unnamed protein product [Darwinula stevensoni]|uniref:Uncharacterized protein n=1 Tax=Darwinula stevensoni TaxID=69355 RepID=A0A7R9FNY2_9CRUS|nr:unnamed protein product [Darwinula stevensoni]CAG0897235.1 unnamed protein product [Darwinula stevensoni]
MSRTPLTCMHHGPNNEEVDCVMDEVNLKGYINTCGYPLQANFTFSVPGIYPNQEFGYILGNPEETVHIEGTDKEFQCSGDTSPQQDTSKKKHTILLGFLQYTALPQLKVKLKADDSKCVWLAWLLGVVHRMVQNTKASYTV